MAQDDDVEIDDDATVAFLAIKKDQFEKGLLRLSAPMTAKQWRIKVDGEMIEARALIATANAKK
jgi:hypothetical protein